MKGRINRTIVTILTVVTVLGLSGTIAGASSLATDSDSLTRGTAYWTTGCSVYVPGLNGNETTTEHNVKQTVTKTASFKATAKSPNNNVDARLINSNNEARSSWARNLPVNTVVHASTKDAYQNYEYRAQISSDLLSPAVSVTLNFSADNLS